MGVDLLFDDGEDYGDFSDSTETLLGARNFTQHLPPGYSPMYAILWDMVGIEICSCARKATPKPSRRKSWIWFGEPPTLGYGRVFVRQPGPSLIDDHVPLQYAGIHAIDVVDFDYGSGNRYHHSTEDTLDKVSAQSLQIVGNVALALLRRH